MPPCVFSWPSDVPEERPSVKRIGWGMAVADVTPPPAHVRSNAPPEHNRTLRAVPVGSRT
jgi:hypothetical protein